MTQTPHTPITVAGIVGAVATVGLAVLPAVDSHFPAGVGIGGAAATAVATVLGFLAAHTGLSKAEIAKGVVAVGEAVVGVDPGLAKQVADLEDQVAKLTQAPVADVASLVSTVRTQVLDALAGAAKTAAP